MNTVNIDTPEMKTDDIGDTAATDAVEQVQDKNTMIIAGSGSNIPITQALLDAYGKMTGIYIQIPPSIGTAGAVKALQAKELDIGLISRPLMDSEKEAGIRQKDYAQIGIVFGVHPSVPDDNIQSEDLINIYKGSKNTWFNGENIIVLIREEGDSSNKVLEEKIPGFKEVLEESLKSMRWQIMYTDGEASDAIKNTNNSLGITDTTAIVEYKEKIKPLKFNGVEPTVENIRNQSYPLVKGLYFAYDEPLSSQAAQFLEFVYSEAGQNVILNNGGLPIKGD